MGYYGRCICCNDGKAMSDENPYCENCQPFIREVFDKDAFCLGQLSKGGGSFIDLDWTTRRESDE